MQYRIAGKGSKRKLEFSCPHCHSSLNSPLSEAGQAFPCPTCQSKLVVPGLAELNAAREEERRERQAAMDAQAERERQESERLQWAQQQREAAQQLAAAAAPAPAAVMSYMAAAGAVPDYFGLRFGSMILRVFAMLYYLGGVVALIVAIVMMAAGSRSNELAVAAGFSIAPAFGAITLIGVGGMFHAGAEMCSAVRDIARNSFRK